MLLSASPGEAAAMVPAPVSPGRTTDAAAVGFDAGGDRCCCRLRQAGAALVTLVPAMPPGAGRVQRATGSSPIDRQIPPP